MSPPRQPPNYRPADTPGERCGTCEMLWHGQCWGYGNKLVQETYVCDSWESDDSAAGPGADS